MLLSFVTSCKEAKKEEVIILEKPKEAEKPKRTITQDSLTITEKVTWGDKQYTVKLNKRADKSLPIVKNEETGDKYYDNTATIKVLRDDNTEAFSKTFTKEFFKEHIAKDQYKYYSLIYIRLDEKIDNNLKFIVTLGDPDSNSDNYINLHVLFNKAGAITVKPYIIDEKTGDEATFDDNDMI